MDPKNQTLQHVDPYDLHEPQLQPGRRTAYVGPPGSHGEIALAGLLGLEPRGEPPGGLPCRDVTEALRLVENGEVRRAIVPWRNALGGTIHESLDGVMERDLHVTGARLVPTRLCLAARRVLPLAEIREIRSHPEALRSCRGLLRQLSGAQRGIAASTSRAAQDLAREDERLAEHVAVLCSPEAARAHGLQVVAADVADHPDNTTLFVVVEREPRAQQPEDAAVQRTALLMTTSHGRGTLARCLTALAEAGVQLTHLESRPLPGRPWEVQFSVEAEGHPGRAPLREALAAVRPLCTHLRVVGTWSHDQPGRERPVEPETPARALEAVVDETPPPSAKPELLVERAEGRERTVVQVGDVKIGDDGFVLMAGPCSVESAEQVGEVARAVRAAGGSILRGGAYKPRTSPYAFQGLGEEGLRLLAEAGRANGLPVVTEVMRPEQVPVCARYADVLQVGARNMQNFPLLSELGACHRPVLLKRGMSATLDEVLWAAEYILARGNTQVILCERGIRTFERATRSTLDLSAIPVLLERTHLPVIVDPSHAAGVRRYVPALARAARAVGAHGIIVEVHPEPAKALSDGPQALTLPMWRELAAELAPAGNGADPR